MRHKKRQTSGAGRCKRDVVDHGSRRGISGFDRVRADARVATRKTKKKRKDEKTRKANKKKHKKTKKKTKVRNQKMKTPQKARDACR